MKELNEKELITIDGGSIPGFFGGLGYTMRLVSLGMHAHNKRKMKNNPYIS